MGEFNLKIFQIFVFRKDETLAQQLIFEKSAKRSFTSRDAIDDPRNFKVFNIRYLHTV